MKIIGHRGAKSLALENSLASIRAALEAGVDAVEFDIRLSADGTFFLSHDPVLGRVSDKNLTIKASSDRQLAAVRLLNGELLPTLSDALAVAGRTPVVLDVKGGEWAQHLAAYLTKHSKTEVTVISFNHQELLRFHQLAPSVPCYPLERTKPFEALRFARLQGFMGVDLKFGLLNPFTYAYARHHRLEVIVYTVNSRLVAWYFRSFFRHVQLTTDMPQHFQGMRHSRL